MAVPVLAAPAPVNADDVRAGRTVVSGCVRLPDGSAPSEPAIVGAWLSDRADGALLVAEPLRETTTDSAGCYTLDLVTTSAVQRAAMAAHGAGELVWVVLDAIVPSLSDVGDAVNYVEGWTTVDGDEAMVAVREQERVDLVFDAMTAVPSASLPCPDVENGCDRTWLDPTDPTGRYDDEDISDDVLGGLFDDRDTNDYPRDLSRGNFTAVRFNAVRDHDGTYLADGGVVAVDHSIGPSGQAVYGPCKNTSDTYHGACANPGSTRSYTFVKNWQPHSNQTTFRHGLFIGNSTVKATCPAPCEHYWGQRVQRIDVELYAKYETGTTNYDYVRVRFTQTGFTTNANGGTYGPRVGEVRLERVGQPGIGTWAGFIYRNGERVSAGEVILRIWSNGEPRTSTGGEGLASFSTPSTNANGYYGSGALYAGGYRVLVVDTITGKCRKFTNRVLTSGKWRRDFDVSKDDFGAGMVPC